MKIKLWRKASITIWHIYTHKQKCIHYKPYISPRVSWEGLGILLHIQGLWTPQTPRLLFNSQLCNREFDSPHTLQNLDNSLQVTQPYWPTAMVSETVAWAPLTLQMLHILGLPAITRLQSEEPEPKVFHTQGIPQSHRWRANRGQEKVFKRVNFDGNLLTQSEVTENYGLPENVAFSKYMFFDNINSVGNPLASTTFRDTNSALLT